MSQTTLDDAMAALCAGVLEDAEHPSLDELLAYRDGRLDDDAARSALQEHLSWCSECSRALTVDLAAWPEVELHDPSLARTDEDEAEDWQAIRQHLARDDDHSGTATEAEAPSHDPIPFQLPRAVEPVPLPVPPRPYGRIHLLAAVLFLAVVGLSIQVVRLSRMPVTPQANVFVVDLESAGNAATRDQTAATRTTQVPAGMKTVVFLLVQDDFRPFDDHAVELRGPNGEVVWRTIGLISSPEGGFSVAVPLSILPAAGVEIHLYGVEGGQRELLAVYSARIERSTVN